GVAISKRCWRTRAVRVSSAAMSATSRRTRTARSVMSSRLPIGVPTTYRTPKHTPRAFGGHPQPYNMHEGRRLWRANLKAEASAPTVIPGSRPSETIAVLDFGSQYTQLIARRIREAHVYCEILPHNVDPARLLTPELKGIVLSGGPASVYDDSAPRASEWLRDPPVPVLAICYGM